MTLSVSYSDGSTGTADSGIELSDSKFSSVGEHTLGISYGGSETNVSVLIYSDQSDGIAGMTLSKAQSAIKNIYGDMTFIGFLDNESLMLYTSDDESSIIVLEGEYSSDSDKYSIRLAHMPK